MIRIRKKLSFSLLEVVIAIAICTLSFGLLFKNSASHFQKQLKILKQMEAQRLLQLSYFDILNTWIQKGSFENPSLDFASEQLAPLGDREIVFARQIKLAKTYAKTSTQNEQWKKLTFQVIYPELDTSASFDLLTKRVDKKIE